MPNEEFTMFTDRLVLRSLRASDAGELFDLNSDPEVMRYTGEEPFANADEALRFVERNDADATGGLARWAVTDARNGDFMGYCGLRRDGPEEEVDLGFRLFRRYWSRGYATEAARASLAAGFERFGLERIIGRAMRENLPSITVLRKLGMQLCRASRTPRSHRVSTCPLRFPVLGLGIA